MKKFFDKIFKDKRILVIYILVIILIVAGVTYALNISSLNLAGTTAVVGIDEEAYGETSIDTSGIKLRPILDNKVETSLENVIKIDFLVGGNRNNTTDEVIYDIALVDLDMDDELSSPYVKWKLVKNGKNIFYYDDFSDVSSGERVVLTTEQQDLVPYNEDKTLYDSYTFYLWLSDSCQKSIGSCTNYVDQSDLLNKHISGKIEVELYTGNKNGQGNGNVIEGVNAASYVMNLYDNSQATDYHIGGDTSKPTVSLDVTSGIMLDNNEEYRYYGASPNNYVSFNNELWRIINVSNVKSSESDATGETRVRIIRADSIGEHHWNYNGISNWEEATLNTTLNGIYYNSTSGTCYYGFQEQSCDYENGEVKGLSVEARSLIDNAVWYLGGTSPSVFYADDYYKFERGTTVYGDNPTRTVSPLGIMYPSDYAYAADLSLCLYPGFNWGEDGYNYLDCFGTDWLYNNENQWLLSTISSGDIYAFYVQSDGIIYGVDDNGYINEYSYAVRPVAVLKSNVIITGGTGTSGDPYKIALG